MIDGQKVRSLRKLKDMSQQDLAEKIGNVQTFVSKIECGDTAITTDTLISISNALGVQPAELLISNPPSPQTRKQRGAGAAVTAAAV